MGADVFFTNASGKTAGEAFTEAVNQARYDHGHAGYTGTLAEKGAFTSIAVPEGEEPTKFADKLIDECDPRVDDKWGPAGCIQTGEYEDTGVKTFLFFGWASS